MGELLWQLGAGELASLIATKQASSREVLDAHLARIEAVNPSINAITLVLADRARIAADAADAQVAAGDTLGRLHGVPFTVKDMIDVAGTPTTQGVPALAESFPLEDSAAVDRMRAVGAIPIGRTNMPDFAMRFETDNALFGPTMNPWDVKHTPGGSSGGEAAALASGMTPLVLGTDLGGSVRIPAYCCGVTALRPSLGRVPWSHTGIVEDLSMFTQIMAVNGPMARRVADLRVAFEALAGPDDRDPWSFAIAPSSRERVPIGVVAEPDGGDTDPSVAASVRFAADVLSNAGYAVSEVATPPLSDAIGTWAAITVTEMQPMWPLIGPMMSTGGRAFLENVYLGWPPLDRDGLAQAWITRRRVGRAWRAFQHDHPLLLGPVLTHPPLLRDADIATESAAVEVVQQTRFCVIANLLGLPSVAVPVGVANGLPQGVQIMGSHGLDETCLAAAQVIEDTVGTFTPIDPR